MKTSSKKPTGAELAILRILWNRGSRSVREINEELNRTKKTTYTTTLKTMQRMFEKGQVSRDESSRQHLYTAKIKEESTQNFMLNDLLIRAFGGSRSKLVLQALSSEETTPEDLKEIEKIIHTLKKERKK